MHFHSIRIKHGQGMMHDLTDTHTHTHTYREMPPPTLHTHMHTHKPHCSSC